MKGIRATLVVCAVLGAMLIPAVAAPAKPKPPRIVPLPTALYDKADRGVWFSVYVFNAKSVSIKFGAHRKQAKQITVVGGPHKLTKFSWQALFKGASRKSCYHIMVTARNDHGSVTRKRKACRLGQQPENLS